MRCRADWNGGGSSCGDATGPKDIEGNVGEGLVAFQTRCGLTYQQMWKVLEDNPGSIHSYADFVSKAPCSTPTPPVTVPTPVPVPTPTVPSPTVPAPATGVCASRPTLRLGSKGDSVRELQSILNSKGESLATDGDFGPKTHSGVINFQWRNGLTGDGIVGPITWGALC